MFVYFKKSVFYDFINFMIFLFKVSKCEKMG